MKPLMAAGIGDGGDCDPFSSKQGFLMPNLGSGGVMSTSHALPSPGCVASLSVGHSFLSSKVEAHQGEPTEFSGGREIWHFAFHIKEPGHVHCIKSENTEKQKQRVEESTCLLRPNDVFIFPKHMHVLIPRSCEYVTSHSKRDFASMNKLRNLRWGHYPRLSGGPNMITRASLRGRQEGQSRKGWCDGESWGAEASVTVEERLEWCGAVSQGVQVALRSWKKQGNGFSSRTSRRSFWF